MEEQGVDDDEVIPTASKASRLSDLKNSDVVERMMVVIYWKVLLWVLDHTT